MAGSTNRLDMLKYNYLTVMYQAGRNSLYDETMGKVQSIAALNAVTTTYGTSNNVGNSLDIILYSDYKAALDLLMLDFVALLITARSIVLMIFG